MDVGDGGCAVDVADGHGRDHGRDHGRGRGQDDEEVVEEEEEGDSDPAPM